MGIFDFLICAGKSRNHRGLTFKTRGSQIPELSNQSHEYLQTTLFNICHTNITTPRVQASFSALIAYNGLEGENGTEMESNPLLYRVKVINQAVVIIQPRI